LARRILLRSGAAHSETAIPEAVVAVIALALLVGLYVLLRARCGLLGVFRPLGLVIGAALGEALVHIRQASRLLLIDLLDRGGVSGVERGECGHGGGLDLRSAAGVLGANVGAGGGGSAAGCGARLHDAGRDRGLLGLYR